MVKTKNWKKNFFTIYICQAFSLLSSSAVQFSIIWWITTLQYVMLIDIIGATLAVLTLCRVKISKHKVTLSGKLNVINDMKQGIKAIKANKPQKWVYYLGT